METTVAPERCVDCGTELAAGLRSCPACGALVHRARLQALAAKATALETEGRLEESRRLWTRTLDLLPPTSQQYAVIQAACGRLAQEVAKRESPMAAVPKDAPWWKRGVAAAVAAVLLVLGKLKFLLLGLTKLSTIASMALFARLSTGGSSVLIAIGVAVSIYIHEMGHVAALKQAGMDAEAPLFVPGIGAFVLLKRHIADPVVDATVGLAGPIWGLGAAIVAYGVAKITGEPTWQSIARWGALLNLFNLVPVWQLDGARAFHALSRVQRWLVVAALVVAYTATQDRLVGVIGLITLARAFQRTAPASNRVVLAKFVGLVAALTLIVVAR